MWTRRSVPQTMGVAEDAARLAVAAEEAVARPTVAAEGAVARPTVAAEGAIARPRLIDTVEAAIVGKPRRPREDGRKHPERKAPHATPR